MQIIDTPSRRVLPSRDSAPVAFVLHNSGEQDLDKCLAWYTATHGEGPHWFITVGGIVHYIVDEGRIAWHTKIEHEEGSIYAQGWATWSACEWVNGAALQRSGGELARYREWRDTWHVRGLESPLELVTGWHPNGRSIGIELQNPPAWARTKDLYTDDQYRALGELLADRAPVWHLPLRRDTVLGHYDVSPMRRSDSSGNWDPGALFKWGRVWDLLRHGALTT
jgi:N-acetyl-anhydromuramyl-L-alanine amidase AmpD